MKARDLMQGAVKTLPAIATLRDAACFFRREKTRGVQVLGEQGRSGGVFSYEDLLNALASGAALSEQIGRFARPMMCSVHQDTDISELRRYGSAFLTLMDGARVVGSLDVSALDELLVPGQRAPNSPEYEAFRELPEPLFVVDMHWRVRWCNPAAAIFCPGDLADSLHKPLTAVLHAAGFETEVDPYDNTSLFMAWREETRYLPITWRVRQADDSIEHCILLRNVQEAVLRARELAKLRHLSKELDAIIESSFDGIFITDGAGRALKVNKAYERITGLRAREVLGRTMGELVGAGYYNESVTLRVLETRRTETIIQKVKDTKTIVVTGNPVFDDQGQIWRVVTNVRDVTELRNLQRELERLAALEREYRREIDSLRRNMHERQRIIVRSQKMREIHEQALRLAQVDSSVLITGESGTGKEVVAELIHTSSPRHHGPFVKISCAAIPEQLLESELFGYTAGAFTGALRTGKRGVFETANGGTLFLDEIGEMPLGLQAKLLRVLQERSIVQLGGVRPVAIDVRIIAATNRNLEEMVQRKEFRSDLYYRLNVVPLVIPPLRERQEAIFDFIYHFLGMYNQKYGLSKQIDPEALDLLTAAQWPGNVRQLGNTMERLVVMARGDLIAREDAHKALHAHEQPAPTCDPAPEPRTLQEVVEQAEREALHQALRCSANTRAAAQLLGVNQSTVVRKARRYGLSVGNG